MSVQRIGVWILAAVLASAAARAAEPRVLLGSGIKIDGLGIASLENPQAMRDGAVAFVGTETRLTVGGHTFTSGDPLPAPLLGTFEEILQGQVAGGTAGVLTAANGPDVASAIFVVEQGDVTPLVTLPPTEPATIRRFAMNARGDIVYQTRSGCTGDLWARTWESGVTTHVAGPDRHLRVLRALVIDATGATAWMHRGGVFYWDAVHGSGELDGDGRPLPRAGGSPVALHPTFGVGFATRDEAVLWSPATGVRTTLVRRGQEVAGARVARVYGDVSFLDDGTVAIGARLRKSEARYLCIGSAGPAAAAPCGARGTSSAGETVDPERSSAIFRLRGTDVAPLVRPGDQISGLGSLTTVGSHVVDGTAIAFAGTLADGRDVLARWVDGVLRPIAVEGQRVGSMTLADLGPIQAAGRSFAAVAAGSVVDEAGIAPPHASGLVVVRPHGRVQVPRAPRGQRFDGWSLAGAVVARERLLVFSGERNGLFAARRRRLVPLVVVRPKGSIRSVEQVAGGTRAFFVATDSGGVGLYELRGGRPHRVASLPGLPWLIDASGSDVAVAVDDVSVQRLEVLRGGAFVSVVSAGDATSAGAVDSIDGMTLVGDQLVVSAGLSGDGAHHALLAVDRGQ